MNISEICRSFPYVKDFCYLFPCTIVDIFVSITEMFHIYYIRVCMQVCSVSRTRYIPYYCAGWLGCNYIQAKCSIAFTLWHWHYDALTEQAWENINIWNFSNLRIGNITVAIHTAKPCRHFMGCTECWLWWMFSDLLLDLWRSSYWFSSHVAVHFQSDKHTVSISRLQEMVSLSWLD